MPTPPRQSRATARPAPPRSYLPSVAPDRASAGAARHAAADRAATDRAAVCEVDFVDRERVARARRALPAAPTFALLAETLRALGDPTRLKIVAALAADGVGELCVCDLAVLVGVSDSAVSHSLRTLRQLRLVRYRKDGKIAYYALTDAHVARLVTEGVRHVEDGAPASALVDAGPNGS